MRVGRTAAGCRRRGVPRRARDQHDRRVFAGRRHRPDRTRDRPLHREEPRRRRQDRGGQSGGRGRRDRFRGARRLAGRRLHHRLRQHAAAADDPDRAPGAVQLAALRLPRQHHRRPVQFLGARGHRHPGSQAAGGLRQGEPGRGHRRHHRHRLGRPPRDADVRARRGREAAPYPVQGFGRRARRDHRQADHGGRDQHRRGAAVSEGRHADPQSRADEPRAHQPRARPADLARAGLRHRALIAARAGRAERAAAGNPRAPHQGGRAGSCRPGIPGQGGAVLLAAALPGAGAVRSAGARRRRAVPRAVEGNALGG
jgi:hypothetical protein